MVMELSCGKYALSFKDGGVEVKKEAKLLYRNKRPLFVTVKTAFAISEYYNAVYSKIHVSGDRAVAGGVLTTPSGSVFQFEDTYQVDGEGFRVSRSVRVEAEGTDLGFSTKLSFAVTEADDPAAYNCFAPGYWYRQNEYAPDFVMGKDLTCDYYWFRETRCALPVFAMQNIASGETAAVSRYAADITMRSLDLVESENSVDPKFTIGSLGMSKPSGKTVNYLYYGFPVRTDISTQTDGLSIDYVYPGCDGQNPQFMRFGSQDYQGETKTFQRINHPVKAGFEQHYAIAVHFGHYGNFQDMMRNVWRMTYKRLRDRLFEVDNAKHFHHCMKMLSHYTRQYGDAWGLPFACQLPDMDISSVSFQFGFVGQQPGIGYQLLRYGDKENDPDAFNKGLNVLDFWVRVGMTESGMPQMCYHPGIKGFEPYPFYVRMMADGLEAILDAYRYLRKKGDERPAWREFLKKAADWMVSKQNEDGSFYRSYGPDGSIRMDSKSNTPSLIRFLVQFYLVTGEDAYKTAAVRAGEWTYKNAHPTLEYRGGTCDNTDIQDKEAGIYGIFGFLALYDLTGEPQWLEAAVGAADYTETWTYAWQFPVVTSWPKHPFNKYSISGQSIVTISGGADVYMAACSYTYYRLYLITGDTHYLDFAEFIHQNTRQSNDIDGSIGYCMPGLGHESGMFAGQTMMSNYHWLPWCTFVEVDPSSRLYDTFGGYEIADAQKLSPAERAERNRIYDHYA
jgi:hypothetical protein